MVVDLKAVEPLPKPVTLAAIKAEKTLKDMALVKYSRLSVQPVTAAEWKIVCKMGGDEGLNRLRLRASPSSLSEPGEAVEAADRVSAR